MYITYELRVKMLGAKVPSTYRRELIAIWRALRRFSSVNINFGGTKEPRDNPRYILDVQSFKFVDDFAVWARERGWKPGYVPILKNPSLVPNTQLEFTHDRFWENGNPIIEKNVEPVHRRAGTVPEYLWVTNYDVRFISVQALHRRKKLPPDLPNYSLQRLRRYRNNSNRHKQGTTIFEETKSLRQWAQDPRCSVSLSTLTKRIKNGIDPEVALRK